MRFVLVTAILALPLAVLFAVLIPVWRALRQKAMRRGFTSVGDYLRAIPQSDQDKQDAVDLALKGLVTCLIGLLLPPVLLIGVFPLFYGVRKLVYVSMGLGLVDDADHPGA